jgi:hypothetical protein
MKKNSSENHESSPSVSEFALKPHPWKPGTMVQVVGDNPNAKISIPLFKQSTAPGIAFDYISVGTLVMYSDCDAEPGGIPRMCQVIYKENIGWVYRHSVMSIPTRTLYKLTHE